MSLEIDLAVALRGRTMATLKATVEPGAVLSVIGPSGGGKTSLLLAVAGLLDAPFTVTGTVTRDGTDLTPLPPERRRMGLMFQDALLYPHMSVVQNVLFAVPRREAGRRLTRAERRARAEANLARVEMGHAAARDPDTLSGGQTSRVALARTLASAPRTLLLDEPFSALDPALRAQVRAFVFDLARQDGLPVVMVSHDPADAEAAGGQIIEIRSCQAG
ncbi:ATP-binding cassette domain-containing protein [Acuticoccus sp. I52.16.1]|uniref:ATP-binding cassette domain-containing protein n=1 Tax=Acuticoccus sp. I52.16.1 TaxID=2928472 RepID=UPI001FD2C42B|nr:ATP-binding cassette domain-containing protein [Acuticoccus sp. I52.16.1]UOM35956.1 ATP-binding cassette domain-containing protein [Acuticoccus sp. I52.16.1]